jgi:hypothetical protein
MAIANVELGAVAFADRAAGAINGTCLRSEALAISGSAATLAAAVSTEEIRAGVCVARVQTDDTACYVAVGSTPSPDAVVKTSATSARRLVPAGGYIELQVVAGDKVAVKAVA